MSSKKANPYADYEFLRSATAQKEYTENEHDVVVRTAIALCRSPCVVVVRVEAWEACAEKAERMVAGYTCEWPNATTTGWTATLFQAYVKLDGLVEESRLSAEIALGGGRM